MATDTQPPSSSQRRQQQQRRRRRRGGGTKGIPERRISSCLLPLLATVALASAGFVYGTQHVDGSPSFAPKKKPWSFHGGRTSGMTAWIIPPVGNGGRQGETKRLFKPLPSKVVIGRWGSWGSPTTASTRPNIPSFMHDTPTQLFSDMVSLGGGGGNDDDEEAGSYDPTLTAPTESDIATAANELASVKTSVDLPDEISHSFLQYALSIILGRALPDARDGLKPVHRRILYAMSGLNLTPSSSHRKCARVVGEVLGKYHPHGDVAVYDALVRMAQTFASGTPLIDGHGNFGSVDNDPAAAMRYTECRLTNVGYEAMGLDGDIAMDTVDYIPNFDGNEMEPLVLPAKLPFLLLNGASGIAVGMATNVPPHNMCELIDASVALLEARDDREGGGTREVTDEELFRLVPGPDFPTAGMIMGRDAAREMYRTGHGGVQVRAKTHMEQIRSTKRGKPRSAIIVTELPYQVNKAALLERIADMVNEKKLDGVADLRDESDRDGVRVVIELKRDAVPAVVENNLFKRTSLQTTFSGNFLALMGTGGTIKPERFTLRSALDCFLDYRFDTVRRRASYQLDKDAKRAHIVEGLLQTLDSADQVIEMIRAAPDQAAARQALMDTSGKDGAALGLSRAQADAVLRLQLGSLTRLNKDKLSSEKESLDSSMASLRHLLTDAGSVRTLIAEELGMLKDKFGTPRKTEILSEEGELNDIDLVENSRSVIVVTRSGYMKRMPLDSFGSQRRGTRGKKGTSGGSSGEDGEVAHCFTCNDHDSLLIISERGVAYGIRAFHVPLGSRTAKGVPIPSVLPVGSEDVIASILPVSEFSKNEYIVLATEHGWIKKTPLDAFETLTSRGLIAASLADGDRLRWCEKCTDDVDILVGSSMGMATRFASKNVRPTGRTSRGVRSMRLREADRVADVSIIRQRPRKADGKAEAAEYVLAVTTDGNGKRVRTEDFRSQARGGLGVIAIKFKGTRGVGDDTAGGEGGLLAEDTVACLRVVHEDDEVLLVTEQGIIVRQKVSDIPCQGRAATGVILQKLDDGDVISSVSIVPEYDAVNEQ